MRTQSRPISDTVNWSTRSGRSTCSMLGFACDSAVYHCGLLETISTYCLQLQLGGPRDRGRRAPPYCTPPPSPGPQRHPEAGRPPTTDLIYDTYCSAESLECGALRRRIFQPALRHAALLFHYCRPTTLVRIHESCAIAVAMKVAIYAGASFGRVDKIVFTRTLLTWHLNMFQIILVHRMIARPPSRLVTAIGRVRLGASRIECRARGAAPAAHAEPARPEHGR